MAGSDTDGPDDGATRRVRAALTASGLSDGHAGLAPLRAGWGWTELWRVVDRDGRDLVLRIFPGPSYGPDAALAAEREAAAHRAARSVEVAAPEVFAVVTVEVPGEPPSEVMVTALAPGVTLAAYLAEHPHDADELGRQCGAVLTRLSRAPAPAVVAARSWRDWPATDPLGDEVRERMPVDGPECLLHLDLHPENVLVVGGGGGPRVSAVLDWANARVGPPAADLARSLAIVDLVRENPDLPVAAATLDAYAAGLIDGSGGRAPAPEYRWWALAVQIDDLTPVAARADDWLRPTDVAAWRRRLRQAMQLPETHF